MPSYWNSGETRAVLPGYRGLEPGETVSVSKYVILPDDSPIQLYSHEPFTRPSTKLHAATLPVSITSGLAAYVQIEINNQSGAIVSVVFNEDADHQYVIADGSFRTFDSDKEIEALSVTGSGETNVYVYGFKG